MLLYSWTFDDGHNPGLFWKISLGLGLLPKNYRITQNIAETKLQKLKHSERGSYFLTEKIFCFWLDTDYCSSGWRA